MTALLYHSRMTGRKGRASLSKRLGGVALAALVVFAQPLVVPSGYAQPRGGGEHERTGQNGGLGQGSAGQGSAGQGVTGPAGMSTAPSSGQARSGSDGGHERAARPVAAAPSATAPAAPVFYEADPYGGAADAGSLSGEGYDDAAGDIVGTMLDAPDGADGVIKAPEGGSGYSMASDLETGSAPSYAPAPYGNSFLPASDSAAAGAVAAGQAANAEVAPVAADAPMTSPEMASPEMFTPDMAAPAPAAAVAPVATARQSRRDLAQLAHSPVVVELFTSQGCSSCPPADEMLAGLADRPDVLALSWHVDYWDYLGWADEFAKPEFTVRQKQYARAAGERSIYTPQILIGGSDTLIDLRPADLMAMIDNQLARPVALSVTAQDMGNAYQIELTPRAQMKRGVAILLVRYAPVRQVEVKSGENRGMVLGYRNIVLGVDQIATWDGKVPLRLRVSDATASGASYPADTRHAILAQQVGRKGVASGAILAAVKLD